MTTTAIPAKVLRIATALTGTITATGPAPAELGLPGCIDWQTSALCTDDGTEHTVITEGVAVTALAGQRVTYAVSEGPFGLAAMPWTSDERDADGRKIRVPFIVEDWAMTISRTALAADLAVKHDLDEAAATEAVNTYAEQLGYAPGADLSTDDAESIDLSLQAHMAHDTGAPLDAVYEATAELARLRNDVALAEQDWRSAIRTALADGQRVVDIAQAAGISRERVYQIRDGRR